MTRILVVDDEPQILRTMRINLRARGYDVDVAADGTSALRAAAAQPPELVVLDLGLPDMDGVDVIRGLRGWTSVPIIVLSGRAGSGDKVEALDAGADDYVTKPFGVDELLARIRAVTRRVTSSCRWRQHRRDWTLAGRPRRSHRLRRRRQRAGTAHAHRMAPARDPRPKPRQAGQPTAPPAGGLGAEVRNGDKLSAPVHGPAPTQARGRPGAPPPPADRARHGLPPRARERRSTAQPGTRRRPVARPTLAPIS